MSMIRDYGVQRAPRSRAMTIGVIALIALATAALIAVLIVHRATRMSDAREWTASGPPCAKSTPTALAAAEESPSQITMFEGVRFARTHGAIRCTTIGYDEGRGDGDFPVCQFDHPGGLEVVTSFGSYHFLISPMIPATIQVPHGVPTCVVGSSVEIH
jgi:hypothetical protein